MAPLRSGLILSDGLSRDGLPRREARLIPQEFEVIRLHELRPSGGGGSRPEGTGRELISVV